jgi:putative SOS response-associated peptidase YedK
MFVVTEAEAAAIRAVYQQRSEFSAALELRRRFPGITDNGQAVMRPGHRRRPPLLLRPVKWEPWLRPVR